MHKGVGVRRFSDGRETTNVGEEDGDFLPDAAELTGDRVIDDSPNKLLGNKARERPDCALRETHGKTEFVNLLDV
jgi:hypothetical protein